MQNLTTRLTFFLFLNLSLLSAKSTATVSSIDEPTNLQILNITSESVIVNWNDPLIHLSLKTVNRYYVNKIAKGNFSLVGNWIDDKMCAALFLCDPPTNIFASDITKNSATINWTTNDANVSDTEIKYSDSDFDPDLEGIRVDDQMPTITGLQPNTTYYVYIRTACGEGSTIEFSTWEGTSFTTLSNFNCIDDIGLTEEGRVLLTEICQTEDWTYYGTIDDVTEEEDYAFAVDWNPNDLSNGHNQAPREVAFVYIDSTMVLPTREEGSKAVYAMRRWWNVDVIDPFSEETVPLDGPVNIRFFYAPEEKTEVENLAQDFATTNGGDYEGFIWFKTVDEEYFPPSSLTIDGIENSIVLIASEIGTENGVTYVQFDNIASFSGGTGATSVGVLLPVELIEFKGKTKGDNNILTWQTASEENSAYFQIERSENAKDWKKIGQVRAAGNSLEQRSYTWQDKQSIPIAYYRLQMFDADQSSTYSNTIYLNRTDKAASAITISPNPNNGQFNIVLGTEIYSSINIKLYNSTGQLIDERSITAKQNSIVIEEDLEAGLYFLQIQSNHHLYSTHLLIQ